MRCISNLASRLNNITVRTVIASLIRYIFLSSFPPSSLPLPSFPLFRFLPFCSNHHHHHHHRHHQQQRFIDDRNLWAPRAFTLFAIRLALKSIQRQHHYLVLSALLHHLETTSEVNLRGVGAGVGVGRGGEGQRNIFFYFYFYFFLFFSFLSDFFLFLFL